MSYHLEEEKTKNKEPGRWIRPDEIIVINGQSISQGHFYFGGQLSAHYAENTYYGQHETEASLVDPTLKINTETRYFTDQSLDLWPKFISLSPSARGAYIDWLSSDRSGPLTPITYVFIYFYGLERRVLVDADKGIVNDDEYVQIFDELKRLRSIFVENHSFISYSTRLIEVMTFLRPDVLSLPDDEFTPDGHSMLFKLRLAMIVEKAKPVPAELALDWVKFYPEYSLRTPARRCDGEFSQLFKRRYGEEFGHGISVNPNKTRLKLEYYPASCTIHHIEINQKDLPDPSLLRAPVNKLIIIADRCTQDLDAYSRYLGRENTSKDDVAAVVLLPDELVSSDSSDLISKLKIWANEKIKNKSGLVHISELWSHTGTPLPEKINKKEAELIQKLTQKAGYGVAPDIRYHDAKPAPDGNIVLFSGGHGDFFEPSKAFNSIGMALRLGAMVAKIDSDVDECELTTLYQLIDHNTQLSLVEKASLHAYLTWRLNTPANMAGLKAKLERLGNNEKSAIHDALIKVALADGKIDPSEIKQLEKLYTALGLDKSLVTSDLHRFSAFSATKTTNKPFSTELPASNKPNFSLDKDVLALHESETKDVQSMLGKIFVDDEPEQITVILQPSPASLDNNGLDTPHYKLYSHLISKERWLRKEVAESCLKLEIMLDGALETINDWSYEKVDAPVLDDDGDIYIDLEIVEELQDKL